MLYPWSYKETCGKLGHVLSSCVIHILHAARTSNVDGIICSDEEKDRKCGAWLGNK